MTTALADLRAAVATAIAGTDPMPEDSTVLPDVVDALSPPAFLIVWGTPWLLPSTYCAHSVRLDVVCIAGRMDPAPGIETLETMVSVALNRLRAARLPEATVLPPGPFEIGGVRYLAARLSIETQISIPEPVPPGRSLGGATLTATATLVVAGVTAVFPTKSGAAVLVASATLTVTASSSGTSPGAATLSAGGTLTATGQTIAVPKTGGAALTAAGTLTATGSTPAGFTPASLPGLVGWWDASDAASITATAGKVSQWANKAPSAIHATQSTGTAQPVTGTRTINGRNVLDFAGSGAGNQVFVLASQPAAGAAAGTAFHVVAMDTFADGGGILGGWGSPSSGSHFPYTDSSVYDTFANTAQRNLANLGTYTTAHVYSVVSAASDWRAYFDGVSKFTTATNTVGWHTSPPRIGAADNFSNAFFYDGRIAEIIVCNVALSTTDRQATEAYLKAKWGTP